VLPRIRTNNLKGLGATLTTELSREAMVLQLALQIGKLVRCRRA
jgi:hypothetical protein